MPTPLVTQQSSSTAAQPAHIVPEYPPQAHQVTEAFNHYAWDPAAEVQAYQESQEKNISLASRVEEVTSR